MLALVVAVTGPGTDTSTSTTRMTGVADMGGLMWTNEMATEESANLGEYCGGHLVSGPIALAWRCIWEADVPSVPAH